MKQRGEALELFLISLVIIALIAAVVFGIQSERREQEEWAAFSATSHCKVVGEMEGDTITGVGPAIGGKGGVAVTFSRTHDKLAWLCDDGMTYWRNK